MAPWLLGPMALGPEALGPNRSIGPWDLGPEGPRPPGTRASNGLRTQFMLRGFWCRLLQKRLRTPLWNGEALYGSPRGLEPWGLASGLSWSQTESSLKGCVGWGSWGVLGQPRALRPWGSLRAPQDAQPTPPSRKPSACDELKQEATAPWGMGAPMGALVRIPPVAATGTQW